MSLKNAKIGMKVRINKIDKTHELYDSCIYMSSMVGKIAEIENIIPNHNNEEKIKVILHIEGYHMEQYIWSPSDLSPATNIKPMKSEKFDINNIAKI